MNLLSLLMIASMVASADSLSLGGETEKSDRNMELNAESATVPRVINIGLPDSGTGAVVYVDGVKHAYGLPRSQYHWSGGNAYEASGSIGLMESVIVTGEIGVVLDSRTKMGGDRFAGAISARSSTNGLIRLDAAVGGPFKAKGWYYSAGAYVNYDPTNVNAPNRKFVDQKQIYQTAISRRWRNADLNFMYKFSICNDLVDGGYSAAPFVYNGDGTISEYNGFHIGRDCYFPADDAVNYMDLASGMMRSGRMGDMDHRMLHDFTVKGNVRTDSGWDLGATLHTCYLQPSQFLKISLVGIDKVDASMGYSTSDGTPFSGYVQNRLVKVDNLHSCDTELALTAVRNTARNKFRSGVNFTLQDQYEAETGFIFGHTVEADPARIYRGGKGTWSFNTNGSFFRANKFATVLYLLDEWALNNRLTLRGGLRLKPMIMKLDNAAKMEGDTKNARVDGFNLADRNLCEIHHLSLPGIDYAASGHVSYRIAGRLFAVGEGFYSITNKSSTYYKNSTIPSTKPIGNALARAGFTFDNSFCDFAAMFSYITSWNNATSVTVTKQIGGVSETIPWTAQYGIGTMGVNLDGNIHNGGLNLHAMMTWQDPRYNNYTNEFVFSDGSVQVIDYTGNFVTGISQVMLELDPSYSWDGWKAWFSGRYYSRQYVNRTNNAFFSGHWETFCGLDKDFSERIKLSLNLVNVFFQNGAKGNIDAADTIEDASLLKGLVMAGNYIRPFTVELGITCKI